MTAALWQALTTLNLTRRRVKSNPGATGQQQYAMWLERRDVGPGRHRAPR